MKAEEARRIAYEFNTNEANSEYNNMKTRIKDAALKGQYEAYFNGFLKPDVHNKLKEEGYDVKVIQDRDGDYHSIKWE